MGRNACPQRPGHGNYLFYNEISYANAIVLLVFYKYSCEIYLRASETEKNVKRRFSNNLETIKTHRICIYITHCSGRTVALMVCYALIKTNKSVVFSRPVPVPVPGTPLHGPPRGGSLFISAIFCNQPSSSPNKAIFPLGIKQDAYDHPLFLLGIY